MKRLLKMLLTLIASTLALLLIAILIIVFVIDLNDYKPQIANLVEQQIGRTLTIEGDINLSFYPWLGFKLGKVSLGNASGFDEPEFAKFEQAQAKIKVLPLFKKQIEISTVLLEGAEINLTRNPDGKTNWEDLAKLGGKSSEEKPKQEKPKEESVKIKSVIIKGINLHQTKIVFNDKQTGSRYQLSDVSLKTSALLPNKPIKLQFNAALAISGDTNLTGQVNLDTQISLNLENQQYRIEPLQFTASVQGDKIPDGKQSLSINTQLISVNLKEKTLTLSGVIAKMMESILTTKMQINYENKPSISGNLKLTDFKLSKLLNQLGLGLDKIPALLQKEIAFETQFQGNKTAFQFKKLQLSLDGKDLKTALLNLNLSNQTLWTKDFSLNAFGAKLTGRLNLESLYSQPHLKGNIKVGEFNLKKLLKGLNQAQLVSAIPNDLPFHRAALELDFQFSQKTNKVDFEKIGLRLDDYQFQTPNIKLDIEEQTLDSESFSINILGMDLTGKAHFKQIFSRPIGNAKLAIAPFNPEKLLKLPITSAALQTNLTLTTDELRLDKLKMHLDDSEIIGQFSIQGLKKPAIAFNLNVDKIDIDKYLAPTIKPTQLNQYQYNKTPSTALSGSGEKIQLPLETLRALNIKGELKIGQLKAAQLNLKELELDVLAKNGKIRLSPKANLYEGKYQGNFMLDAEQDTPHLVIEQTLKDVQSRALFKDLTGSEKIAGIANISTHIQTQTQSLENLTGTISFSFTEGAIKGFNIKHSLLQPKTLIGTALPYDDTIETKFGELRGTFKLEKGTLYTENLLLKSTQVDITGKGSLELSNKNLRFDLNTTIVKPKSKKLQFLTGVKIPFQIMGKLKSPALYIDKGILLKYAKQNALGKIEQKKQELLKKHGINSQMQDFMKNLTIDDLLYK